MKHLWMLFDKRDGKLVSWTVFPTRKAANAYKTLGQNLWLQAPYCCEGVEVGAKRGVMAYNARP